MNERLSTRIRSFRETYQKLNHSLYICDSTGAVRLGRSLTTQLRNLLGDYPKMTLHDLLKADTDLLEFRQEGENSG